MTTPRALVAGNWKMNGVAANLAEIEKLNGLIAEGGANCDVLVCPPFTLIHQSLQVADDRVDIGAQDCHANFSGAHTGDIAAGMLQDQGCKYVIVGHSERRTDHHEHSELVSEKAKAVQETGLIAIICVGETEGERDGGNTLPVVTTQVRDSIPADATADNTVIAYEPVWAIGTGRTPTIADVAEVHAAVRQVLVERFGDSGNTIRILYGGSVKPENARELMSVENVNGALVGGASLKADSFYGIIQAYD
ncbi:triose-phosphate isomerase [Emcibacter sp.]|uniref:triose-phosphate isomerase n=1 Tax=Emcibacter sp. TaxID=1979954 RepID=UPI003A94A8B9